MPEDFSEPYRGVAYFGLWADDTADDYGVRDACAVIRDAVLRCYDEDMRTERVFHALRYLVRHGGLKDGTERAFRQALDAPHPRGRVDAAGAVYALICRHLDRPDPAIAAAQRTRRLRRKPGND